MLREINYFLFLSFHNKTHSFFFISGHGIVALKVPASEPGLHTLHTIVGFIESENGSTGNKSSQECDYQSRSYLTVVGPVRDVIIRPDKQRYAPGETSKHIHYIHNLIYQTENSSST